MLWQQLLAIPLAFCHVVLKGCNACKRWPRVRQCSRVHVRGLFREHGGAPCITALTIGEGARSDAQLQSGLLLLSRRLNIFVVVGRNEEAPLFRFYVRKL